jgi:predicted DNA-binding transcriptional regulator
MENKSESVKDEVLHGKSLQVYWYLVTNGEKGIREIQKDLNISSSGTVAYQINKLVKAGIVGKNEVNDKYFIQNEVKTGNLGYYVRIGTLMIPRFLFYFSFFFFGLLFYLGVVLSRGSNYIFDAVDFIFLVYLGSAVLIFIFESLNIFKMKPK